MILKQDNQRLWISLILLLIAMITNAQSKTITGTITDETGIGMPGVTIILKGTVTGTISDIEGHYSLSVPSPQSILVFSFTGYVSAELSSSESIIDVKMKPSALALDEVVVVGYGVQSKETVTGAISTVAAKDIANIPVSNLNSAITGKLAGVVTVQNSGRPGEDAADIYIRGRSTWVDSNPLIIVDGVERSSFSQIDPNEVESISVLKDASSTAVYGVRGANGVILVTTRRGTEGKPKINISANVGVQKPVNIPDFLGSYDHLILKKKAFENDGLLIETDPLLSDESLEGFRLGTDPYRYPDINWYQEVVKSYSLQQQYNMNVSGGTKRVKYFTSIGYHNQGGMFKYTDINPLYSSDTYYRRFNFRSNIDIKINKYQTFSTNLSGRKQEVNGFPNFSNLMQTIIAKVPYAHPMFNPDNSLATVSGMSNPLQKIAYAGYDNSKTNYYDLVGILKNDLSFITNGLSLDMTLSFNSAAGAQKRYREAPQTFYYNPNTERYQQDTEEVPFYYAGESALNSFKKVGIQMALRHSIKLGESNINSTLVYNQQNDRYGYDIPYVLMGYAARLEYDYKKKYLAELNMGYNGSENFAPGNRFGFFPAASIGYVITQESFMDNVKHIIPFLKVRGSVGLVGNDKVGGSRFLWQGLYQYDGLNSQYYNFGTTDPESSGGIYEKRAENRDLTWETSLKMNAGIEGHLFKDDLLRFSIDVFNENRTDILMSARSLLGTTGIPSPTYNMGEVNNKGYEIDLKHRHSISDISYSITANYSFARNEIINYDDPGGTPEYQRIAGQRIGQFVGYEVLGFFQNEEEILASPTQTTLGGPILPGDLKYRDVKPDNQINKEDQLPIGYSSVPEIVYSISPEITYKGFTISAMLQGAANSSVFFTSNAGFEFGGAAGGGQVTKTHQDYWTPDNLDATYPTLHYSPNHSNKNLNSFHLKSGNYIRLRNAQISYMIPQELTNKWGFTSLKIFISGNNLKTWSHIDDFDPETITQDGEVYPQQSVYNLGVNISL